MWIKFIQDAEGNKISNIVDVGEEEAVKKIGLGIAVGVTGPDGLIEEAVIVDEKPTETVVEPPKTTKIVDEAPITVVKAKIGKKKKK